MRFAALFLISIAGLQPVFGQTESAPLVPDYGIIWDIDGVVKPDPNIQYKILVDLKTRSGNPSDINYGLDRVARMINLHATGGIPAENLDVVVAIHGGATPIALDNEKYLETYNVENPNLELFSQLREAGVTFYVCGQSLIQRKYGLDHVTSGITISLSMLTIASEHLMKGYGMMVFE